MAFEFNSGMSYIVNKYLHNMSSWPYRWGILRFPDNQKFMQNNLRCLSFQTFEVLYLLRTAFCKKRKVHDSYKTAFEKFKSIVNRHTTWLARDMPLRHLNSQNNDPVYEYVTHFALLRVSLAVEPGKIVGWCGEVW